jgi:hypothetical protein
MALGVIDLYEYAAARFTNILTIDIVAQTCQFETGGDACRSRKREVKRRD